MRKMTAFALVSCLSLGATALMAQSTTPSTSMDKPASTTAAATKTKTAKTTTTTKTATTTAKAKNLTTHGAVTAVDATAKTITVKDTYNVSDSTKYVDGHKTLKMEDIKVGDNVYITYTKDGDKNNASRVSVSHAKAKK
jgi:ribosomal protein S17